MADLKSAGESRGGSTPSGRTICDECDEYGWHTRSGLGWRMYYPHGATVKIDVED